MQSTDATCTLPGSAAFHNPYANNLQEVEGKLCGRGAFIPRQTGRLSTDGVHASYTPTSHRTTVPVIHSQILPVFCVTPQIAAGEHLELLSSDQCIQQARAGRILAGMAEGPITFTPTFKLLRGRREHVYDADRVPSWTDRIWFRGSVAQRGALEVPVLAGVYDVRVCLWVRGGVTRVCKW